MTQSKSRKLEIIGGVLVFLMALIQGVYAVYAYVDPAAFAVLRGTDLFVASDTDWVQIYASRTLFVALIIGFLLYLKSYRILVWAALFGTVMPITDAYLAYEANAPDAVVYKHLATFVYLLVTFAVLKLVVRNE